jgi:hypothetical protein
LNATLARNIWNIISANVRYWTKSGGSGVKNCLPGCADLVLELWAVDLQPERFMALQTSYEA